MNGLWLLLFSGSAASATEIRPWLLRLDTVYSDLDPAPASKESAPETVPTSGSGFTVKVGSSYFWVTAGHVTQGIGPLKVETEDGHKLQPLGRYIDNEADLEIAEMSGPLPVLAQLEGKKLRLLPGALTNNSRAPLRRLDPLTLVPLREGLTRAGEDTESSPLNPNLFRNFLGTHWVSFVRLPPGSSGSPLVKFSADGKEAFVEGLALRRERDLLYSTLADTRPLLKMFKAYRRGQVLYANNWRWHMKRGLLYRSAGQEFSELSLPGVPASAVGSPPSGNGLSIDISKGPLDLSSPEILKERRLRSDVFWRKKLALAVRTEVEVRNDAGDRIKLPLFAVPRVELLDFLAEHPEVKEQGPVTEEKHLTSLLQEKLKRPLNNFTCFSVPLQGMSNATLDFVDGRVHIVIHESFRHYADAGQAEVLDFWLEPNGAPAGQTYKHFLQVAGKRTGKIFLLDLRDFFFTDLALWRRSKSGPLTLEEMRPILREAIIRYRPLDTLRYFEVDEMDLGFEKVHFQPFLLNLRY